MGLLSRKVDDHGHIRLSAPTALLTKVRVFIAVDDNPPHSATDKNRHKQNRYDVVKPQSSTTRPLLRFTRTSGL